MCLFYDSPAGHARSDPILNQVCPSDHVHTFYGPQNFHPNTSNEILRNTKPEHSSSPWVENQSLYWHPSIYEVIKENDETVYKRVSNLDTSPYYRWDSALPETVAFPSGFQMIAYSNQDNAEEGGETGNNLLVKNVLILPTMKKKRQHRDRRLLPYHPYTKIQFCLLEPASECQYAGNRTKRQEYIGGTYQLANGSDVFHVCIYNIHATTLSF